MGTPPCIQPTLQTPHSAISLDEKSARTIARGRITRFSEEVSERLAKIQTNRPTKRLAWIRHVKAEFMKTFGDGVLTAFSDNRRVHGLLLHPVQDGIGGWLAASAYAIKFGNTLLTGGPLAYFSAHAIARMLERLRVVDPIHAMKEESFVWALAELTTTAHREHYLLPTKSGYFCGVWDQNDSLPVFTTWLPDRYLTVREQEVLTYLRYERRIGFTRGLEDSVHVTKENT